MSRPLRIEYPGAWYHIMNRGRRSESIFLKKQIGVRFVLSENSKTDGIAGSFDVFVVLDRAKMT